MIRELSKSEQLFIDQMARKKMVEWCDDALKTGFVRQPIMTACVLPETDPPAPDAYLHHAIAKGWVSKDGTKILASGWETAARFLKR